MRPGDSTAANCRFPATAIHVLATELSQHRTSTRISAFELLNLREIDGLILEDVRADKDAQEDANENVDVVVHCCAMLVRYSRQGECMRTKKHDKVCDGELRCVQDGANGLLPEGWSEWRHPRSSSNRGHGSVLAPAGLVA